MATKLDEERVDDDIPLDELLSWMEFGCWSAIVLLPFLYYVNGSAVSTDQYVMRMVLIIVAVAGAIGLRAWNWRRGWQSTLTESSTASTKSQCPDQSCVTLQKVSRFVSAALGVLLVVAAVLKTHQLFSEPTSHLNLLGALALVCFELSYGIWLIVGQLTLWTWRVAIACFLTFGCFSAHKVLTGAISCGCFGTARVDPRVTLAIDSLAVVLLLLLRRGIKTVRRPQILHYIRIAAPLCIMISSLAMGTGIYGQWRISRLDGLGPAAAGELVVLEPDEWIGKKLPLIANIHIDQDLSRGKWDIVLFRHDCHVCHEVMAQIERMLMNNNDGTWIALVAIDRPQPDTQVERLRELGCSIGYLAPDVQWFTTTPLRLRLGDGECLEAAVIKAWQ